MNTIPQYLVLSCRRCTIACAVLLALLHGVSAQPATSVETQILKGQEALYHARFDEALSISSVLITNFPEDPRPYLLQALTYRWLTRIDPDSNTFQTQFEQTVKKTIKVATELENHQPNHENALLTLAAAYGYRAEYYQFQQNRWSKAYDDGVRMQKYLEKAKDLELSENIDIQLGLGLYNYYAYVYRKKIGWWNFLVSLPKGDKAKGIAQINTVREQGTYLRVEAWYFLTEIYKRDADYRDLAIPVAEALHQAYPEHPYFHIFLAGLYHSRQDWRNSLRTAQAVLDAARTSSHYSDYIIYQAHYLVGESAYYTGQNQEALQHFNVIIAAHPSNPDYLLPWAHLRRGTIYKLTEKNTEAVTEYQQVLKLDDVLNVHELARSFLKSMQQ